MDTNLTLKLNSSVIKKAKVYANSKNTSLSQLVETYLNMLSRPDEPQDITPLVKSLSGVVKFPKDYDYKKAYKTHLLDKFSK